MTRSVDVLPLPRRSLTTAVAGVVILAAFAWALPLALLVDTGALPRSFDRSSTGMWALVALHSILIPFVGFRGVGLARGERLEGAPKLLGLSLTPLAVAALVFAFDVRVAASSIEPGFGRESGRILAHRLADLAPITWFAGIVAASAAAVVVTGAASAIATIDHRRLETPRGPMITTVIIGASWLVVSLAVRDHTGVAVRLAVAALASLVASKAPSLRHASNREAVGLLRCALVAAVASAIIVVLGRHVVAVLEEARLSTTDGYAGPRWSASLVQLASARSSFVRSTLLDASGAAACFAVPLGSILRASRKIGALKTATSIAFVAALSAITGVVLAQRCVEDRVGAALAGRNQLALLRRVWHVPPASRPAAPYGSDERTSSSLDARSPILAVLADGTTMGSLGSRDLIASDPTTRFDVFVSTLQRSIRRGCGADQPHPLFSLRLIAPTERIPELGPSLDAFQSPPTTTFDVALWEHDEADLNHGGLGLISTGLPSARVHRNAPLDLPAMVSLADEDADARRRDMGDLFALVWCSVSLRLVPRADDPMQRVLDAVAALHRDVMQLRCAPRIELVLLRPSDPER